MSRTITEANTEEAPDKAGISRTECFGRLFAESDVVCGSLNRAARGGIDLWLDLLP